MDHLRAITLFVQAAAAGSFQRVAVDEAISPQAVSKAVRQLETHLGVRLFHRTTRRSSLTTEGLAFLETVQPALESIQHAVGRARAQTESVEGALRITAAPSARRVITEPIAAFSTLYPAVTFDLVMDNAFTDIVAAQIDVGFRAGNPPAGQVVVRKLFAVQQMLCAAPAYLTGHGMPQSLDDLVRHRCTGFRLATTGRLVPWPMIVDGERRLLTLPATFCANDPDAELDAVLAGIGIGLIDSINGAAAVREGHLVPVLPALRGEELGFYVYYAQRSHRPRRVRAFVDFVVERLRASKTFEFDAVAPSRKGRSAKRQSTKKSGMKSLVPGTTE
jgi:DNA-binding transcriptional LysR family regulator